MAVPKLVDPRPFFRLDPAELDGEPELLAAHRMAVTVAPKVDVSDLPAIDLIVCGTWPSISLVSVSAREPDTPTSR